MANNLKDIYVGVNQNDENRRDDDLYETPPLASYILHKYAPPPKNIVEPCAGRGNISIELARNGYNVKSFDLNDHPNKVYPVITGIDVLSLEKQEGYDAFITNPPYFKDLPRKIAEKGIKEYDYTALFVRLTFLEGIKRYNLFNETPPSDIIIFSDRIRFKQDLTEEAIEYKDQTGGMISYMFIIWDKRKTYLNTNIKWVLLRDEYAEWKASYDSKIIGAK